MIMEIKVKSSIVKGINKKDIVDSIGSFQVTCDLFDSLLVNVPKNRCSPAHHQPQLLCGFCTNVGSNPSSKEMNVVIILENSILYILATPRISHYSTCGGCAFDSGLSSRSTNLDLLS
jgi:hypothetical protein